MMGIVKLAEIGDATDEHRVDARTNFPADPDLDLYESSCVDVGVIGEYISASSRVLQACLQAASRFFLASSDVDFFIIMPTFKAGVFPKFFMVALKPRPSLSTVGVPSTPIQGR